MDKIANTLNFDIYAKASCPNAAYNIGIDDVGQITVTPIDATCNFIHVSREFEEDAIAIHITANMISSDNNFEYFLDIDDIGQIIITPDSENANFESAIEGTDLNLVTESRHIQAAVLNEDVKSVFNDIADKVLTHVKENPECFKEGDSVADLLDELNIKGVFDIPASAPGFECADDRNVSEEEAQQFIDLVLKNTDIEDRIKNDLTESINDEEPYTKEQVESDLKSLTMNWTREDTLKTGFEIEHEYAMEILSQHYETVYDEGRKGNWYYIRFVGPMMKECLSEETTFVWAGKYYDRDGNKKFVYIPKSITGDAEEAADYMEDSIPEPFTKFVFLGTYSEKDATSMGCTLLEGLTESNDNYYTRSDVEAVREKFKKWAFKIDSQHPGFDRYTCKVDDYLLECVFDHKFGSPSEKCFTARVLLNRKTMDYFFTAEDALDFMLANAENKVLDEALNESDDNRAKEAFNNMFGDVEKQLDDLLGKWEDLKKSLGNQKDGEDKILDESKQGECEKCGHTLTDGGQCPVCDLGDEEERTSHTLYEGLSFKEGDILEYSGLFGGSYTSRVTKIEGSKMWVDTSWTAEESGEEVHDEDTFFIVKDDEGNDCIEVYHYQGEVGRVYPPATKVNESYWINNKDIMSEVSALGKQLEADGYKYYGDRDAGGTYFDFYTKPGDNGADCKAVRYNYDGASIVDITVDQLIGKEPLTSFDGLRRKLGKMLLPQNEAMSSSDTREMLKVAHEIGINNAEDLIRFYKDHPAADENKLATIQSYRKELGPDFQLKEGARVSFDLDGKNYKGTYRGQSTTNPDMADVEMDDDCYENPDPYGRYINRRPIYNRHEDRYIKDGKFFIPNSELRFEEE